MGQLTDGMNALIRYSNEVTGASDTTLSEAIKTLTDGYGQGGEKPTVTFEYNVASVGSFTLFPAAWEVEKVEVDGIDNGTSNRYNFTTTGSHLVRIVKPDGIITSGAFTSNKNLIGVAFEGVWEEVQSRAFLASGLQYVKLSHAMKVLRSSSFTQLSLTTNSDSLVVDLSGSVIIENQSIPYRDGKTKIIKVGDGVTSLGGTNGIYSSPFTQYSGDVILGSGLTEVYGGLFDRCYIHDLYVMAQTPPTFISNSGAGGNTLFFQGSNAYLKIYVPDPDLYKAADGWSSFSSYINAIP